MPSNLPGDIQVFDAIRLITFDLDETLWPLHPVIQRAEEVSYAWMQRQTPKLTTRYSLDDLRLHRREIGRRRPEIAHDMTEVRVQSLAELMAVDGYGMGHAREATTVFREARNRVMPYPEVTAALQQLRQRFMLISVTNGNADVALTPLRGCFDHCLTAADVGAAKPDPTIFRVAAERAGVGIHEIAHVGDDPVRDIDAARSIGMRTVWVNRQADPWPDEVERADVEVSDLTGLRERLMG